MTTTTPPRIRGTITDVAFKYTRTKERKEYAELSVLEVGRESPVKCRAFDKELVDRFKRATKGMTVDLAIEEEPGTYQGKSITYRNIVGVISASAGSREAQAGDQSEGVEH